MKSEIAVFMAMRKKFKGFSTHFHGIFMKKRFVVYETPNVFEWSSFIMYSGSKMTETVPGKPWLT